jgi:hypothetical protein
LFCALPSLAIVADVPMHWSLSGARRSRTHEQRNVGALTSPVRVQLVEYQEPEPDAVADDLPIQLVLTGHQELKHHEVRQQNVGRVIRDAPTLLVVLLPGVAGEGDGAIALDVRDELVELLELAVGQRVHRVDDDGARAPRRAPSLLGEYRAHDRDEEAERLAGARARRHHVALALRR